MNTKDYSLIKELLFGAYLRTLDIVNFDNDTVEKGDDVEASFEKQWTFIEPKIIKKIEEYVNQEFEELLESLPEYKAIDTNGRSYGYNQAISEIRNLVKERMKADS